MPQLQLVSDLPGHPSPAWQVSFNPTRSLLASCSTDKTFRLYSYTLPPPPPSSSSSSPPTDSARRFSPADSPKPQFNLQQSVPTEHKKSVRSISWAKSGRTLATGSFDSTVGIWEEVDDEGDVREGIVKKKVIVEEDEDGVGEEREEKEVKEWECVTTLEGHESECKSVAFSSDGGLLGSCSRDKSVWVWEVQPDSDFECIAVMMEHEQDVKCIAWHPHDEVRPGASEDGEAAHADYPTVLIPTHPDLITSLRLNLLPGCEYATPSTRYPVIASASYDTHIHLAYDDPDSDWQIYQKLHPKLPPSPLLLPLNASPSLKAALTPNDLEKAVEALNIPVLEEGETVWCLAFSGDGGVLMSGGDLGGIRLWSRKGSNPDSPYYESLHVFAHSRSVFTLSWSPGGVSAEEGGLGLLASGGGDGKVIVWQITKNESGNLKMEPIAAVRDAHGVSDVNNVAWCRRDDGRGQGLLASCGDDGGVRVWRVVEE